MFVGCGIGYGSSRKSGISWRGQIQDTRRKWTESADPGDFLMKAVLVASVIFISSATFLHAEQNEQSAFFIKAIAVLQAQRNSAADEAANARAHVELLQEQLNAAQARIKELEKPKEGDKQ